MTPADLGTTIRQYRERAGLTQDGLGRLISVDPDLIDQWEWGELPPEDDQADRIAEVLGIPADRVKPPEIIVDMTSAPELVVEFIDSAESKPAAPPPKVEDAKAPKTSTGAPGRPSVSATFEKVRDRVLANPKRSALVGGGILAALVVAFLLFSGGGDDTPNTTTTVPSDARANTLEAALETLREQRDRLADRVEELTAEVEAANTRAAAAEAESERLAGLGGSNDDLAAENERLESENQVLRKAVVVSSASSDVQAVGITLDGSGSPEAIAAALDALSAKGAVATFFPTGAVVSASPAVWQRAVAEGNELGNNTQTNTGISDLDEAALRSELEGWQSSVSSALGTEYSAQWFRPPFMDGFTDRVGSESVRQVIAESGMATALWSVETYYALFAPNGPRLGGSNPGSGEVADYVVGAAGPGSIILLSSSGLDVDALPAIIDGLRAKGLEPTTLTGLFELQEEIFDGDIAGPEDTTTNA